MSEQLDQGGGTWGRAARRVALLCITSCGVWSCQSPLGPRHVDDGPAMRERLQRVEGLTLTQAPPPAVEAPQSPLPPPAVEVRLTIEQVRAYALANNLDLQVQLLSPTIARQQVTEAEAAFEAAFFGSAFQTRTDTPTATLLSGSRIDSFNADVGFRIPLRTGGLITLQLPVNEFETNNTFSILNPSYSTDAVASISQPLLRNAGFRTNEHFIRIAQWNRQRSEAQTKLAVINVITLAEQQYWLLYGLRRELEVRLQEMELAEQLLARARRLVAAGATAEVEIVRAEAGVAEKAEAIIIAQNAVRDAQRQLKRILNRPGLEMNTPTEVIPTTDPNPVAYELNTDRLIAVALDQRMELLETELTLLQNASSVDFARNQTLPLVLAEYGYFVNGLGASFGDSFDLLSEKRFEDHRFGGRFEIPLGNEAAQSRLRAALLTRLQTLATKNQRRAQIVQEVLTSLDALHANWLRILASRQRTILAARVLEAEERQFEQGLRTSTDVLNAQTSLANAQSSEIVAVTAYQISQVNIAAATGMLLGSRHVRWAPADPNLEEMDR